MLACVCVCVRVCAVFVRASVPCFLSFYFAQISGPRPSPSRKRSGEERKREAQVLGPALGRKIKTQQEERNGERERGLGLRCCHVPCKHGRSYYWR